MEIVGYAEIKKNATSGTSAVSLELFKGNVVRVFEFASDGGVLVVDAKATGLATFDACDVVRKFECSEVGEYLTPPGLHFLEQHMYVARLMNRKGGWNSLLRQMLIGSSLHKGKFNDSFLFQKQ